MDSLDRAEKGVVGGLLEVGISMLGRRSLEVKQFVTEMKDKSQEKF